MKIHQLIEVLPVNYRCRNDGCREFIHVDQIERIHYDPTIEGRYQWLAFLKDGGQVTIIDTALLEEWQPATDHQPAHIHPATMPCNVMCPAHPNTVKK